MSRPKVECSPSAWPRAAVLALVGIAAAGCSDSARFDSYNTDRPLPPQSVASATPAASGRVEAQPLPALSQPTSVSAYQSQGAYRSSGQYADLTGSGARVPPPSSHWTWNGGSAVTVGYGDTVESIARKHGVPASAIMQ